MTQTLKLFPIVLTTCFLWVFSHITLSQPLDPLEQYEIIESTNLSQITKPKQNQSKVIMLYISSPFCPFCRKLEAEILKPMLKSGDYIEKVTLRKFVIDSKQPIINFNGQSQSPKSLMNEYQIKATPTLLFLDKNGRQLTEAIVGYSNDEFFWYYLDAAIEKSNQRLNELADGS